MTDPRLSRRFGRRTLLIAAGAAGIGIAAACSRAVQATTGSLSATGPTPSTPASASSGSASPKATPTPTNPQPASIPTGPATEIVRGSGARAQVTLTFHGAGDPAIAEQLLTILAGVGVTVTVLAVGTWLQANPDIATKIVQGGHELGNHTWTHPNLAGLPTAQIVSEITQCRDLVQQLTGSPGPFFRQSAAQHATTLIRTEAGKAGYPTTLSYDIDSLDWTDPGVPAIRAAVAKATAGSIVSMHFGHPQTIAALPIILEDLQARNLTAVTASALLAP